MIPIHRLRPSLVVGLELAELHETQRRAHLINTIIEPGGCDVITKAVATVTIPGQTRHTMRAQQFNALSQLVIICGQHAAFASGEIFIGEKTKAANIANAATLFEDPLAAPILPITRQRHPTAGTWCMCHVLHHIQPMLPCQRHDAVHITGIASIMHHADALGGRVNAGRDTLRGDVTVLGARDIGKDWCGAGIANGIGRGHKGQ